MKTHSEIIQMSLDFMRSNLAQPIALKHIAAATGYSISWLEAIFKRMTGKGMLSHLNQLRVDRAKTLLCETEMDVTEIALELGFSTHSGFFKAFRRIAGTSPIAYRNAAISERQALAYGQGKISGAKGRSLFKDEFNGTTIGPGWKAIQNEWAQELGCLHNKWGESRIALNDPLLPENFRITLEVRMTPVNGEDPSDLYVLLLNSDLSWIYCGVLLGCYENGVGEFRLSTVRLQWNPRAIISVGQWMQAELELKDDTVTFRLNGEEMFRFRDAIPAAYFERSKLVLGCWRGHVEFRKLTIEDLGFFPMVSANRQGDALFNAGSYQAAFDFYSRLLESDQADAIELQYKTGLCRMRQGHYLEATQRLGKVADMPATDFWAQNAKLALLEIRMATQSIESVIEEARNLLTIPPLRGRIRGLLYEERNRQAASGFLRRVVQLDRLILEMEEPGGFLHTRGEKNLGDTLFNLRQYPSAEAHLIHVFSKAADQKAFGLEAGFTLSDVYAYNGRFLESEDILARIRSMARMPQEKVRCDFLDALNLCGRGQHQESLKAFLSMPESYPLERNLSALALFRASMILCSFGDTKSARDVLERGRALYPESPYMAPGRRSGFLYVPCLMEQDFIQAAELLLEDGRFTHGGLAGRAEQMVKAGILLELGGEKEKAREIWAEASRRFPPGRVCFYGSLAEDFRLSNDDHLVDMEYPAAVRSEMFYLAGRLYQSRGNDQRAKELFRMSVQDDPRMAWPAYLSKQKLIGRSNSPP